MYKFLSVQGLFITLLMSLLTPFVSSAQTITIQPYLQNATPTSMVIMWETNTNTESIVQYGLTQNLGSSTSGTTITTPGNTILHTATLSGLTPGTRYYYKAITGAWQSGIFDFVTPPERNSEADVNIVLMSDMQKDGSNPNIFSNLINNSLLPYVAATYGTPLSDHLQMAVLPGDVVDIGSSFLQWKNDFFNPGEALWRSVPSYPAIGNHEANSINYFNYYNLPANGTPGYLEHWYYHDYSNVRVISINSNPGYRIQAQLDWVDSILTISCTDTLIDFVFAEMHHPYKSELWTPGEAAYTGDVVELMEAFSQNCGKPTIHFFGHTHAYSRGQSRDHDHLWVNVATSGGNIDYWGEFSNQDYDEFIVSQDEYGFVMVEVTAGANPQFVLKRLSFGDQYNPGGSTETDYLTVRMNNNAPSTPIPLFPKALDTVSAFCFTMQADGFSDPDGDEFGAAHWQISTDSINFTSPAFESWKQYANWYNEINEQANDDLTNEEVTNLQGGIAYWWRVRYRDKSLEWSPWSTSTRFNTIPLVELTSNLVNNPGAENGITGWTATVGVIESLGPNECGGIPNPYQGQKYFGLGALCVDNPFGSAYQDLDITAHATSIDQGEVLTQFGAYMASWQNTDEPSLALQFLDAGNVVLGGTDTLRHRLSAWTLKQSLVSVPSGTRKIRIIAMGTRFAGNDNDSYIDNMFCKLLTGDLDCSTYSPPGPANGRVYVDENAIGYPDGESWTTAHRKFGDALNQSNADPTIHEIWVADGMYAVTTNAVRDTSFMLTRSVNVYGGFSGNEIAVSQRDIANNITILSGEIADTNLVSDNCYHVLDIRNTVDTVRFDGLHITDGYADGPADMYGGGILISFSNRKPIVLRDCTINNNYAVQGSSIFNQGKVIIETSHISNEVLEGITGCSILNAGEMANMSLFNTTVVQQCANCPDVIQNINGATLIATEDVIVEKTE
jgi:hypothetical protein